MGNMFQRILVFFGFKRTDGHHATDFTNIATVPTGTSATPAGTSATSTQHGKQYSWDKRRAAGTVDRSEWAIKNIVNSDCIRMPGTVAGNDLEIQDCKNSRIFIFDNASQIIVDDCSNCKFIFGAIRCNVFFRNCVNCSAIVATSQFRTRDCSTCDFYLYCETIPIIEASSMFRFHCFQFTYIGLKQHMNTAGLNCFNNNWSTIHDFTPDADKRNFSFVAPPYGNLAKIFPLAGLGNGVEDLHIEFSAQTSCVPTTLGNSISGANDEVALVIAPSITQLSFGYLIASQLCTSASAIKVKQTALHKLSNDDAMRIFGGDFGTLNASCFESGNVLALIIAAYDNAADCLQSVNEAIAGCQTQLKKLPPYSVFKTKNVIEELVRFSASQISG